MLASNKRFKNNLGDLFLSNEVSAARAQSLFSDAQLAGTAHVGNLAGNDQKHAHRNLLRKLI
jgi:hypothetical protein